MPAPTIRIKPGLLRRLRELGNVAGEEQQARLIGVDRTTLRRVDQGSAPSAAFMAAVCATYGLGIGEAFDIVKPAKPELKVAS